MAIELGSTNDSAMVLKNEKVTAIHEYAANKLVMHLPPSEMLIAHKWKVVQIIKDHRGGNTLKQWLYPLPGFDKEAFPYILASGRESFNIVNVKTFSMQVLIDVPAIYHKSQQSAFFMPETEGFSMHFAAQAVNDKGQKQENWYCMKFKADFIHSL